MSKEPDGAGYAGRLPGSNVGADLGAGPMPDDVAQAAARYRDGGEGGAAAGKDDDAGEREGERAEVILEVDPEALGDAAAELFLAVDGFRGNGVWPLSDREKRLVGKVSARRAQALGITMEQIEGAGFGAVWGLVLGRRILAELVLIRKATLAKAAAADGKAQ